MLAERLRRVDQRLQSSRPFHVSSTHLWVLGLVAIAVSMFMLSVALRMYGPTVHPDEFGFLANGQVLIGNDEAPIPTGSFYPAGYGIVTGIGALVSGSLSGAYRFALLTNLVLAVVTAWFAGRLATKEFEASRAMGRLVSVLVFVVPGTAVSAMFAWPETASRLAFLVFVWGVMATARRRTTGRMAALGLYVGLMPALHGRFTLLLPVVCLVFAWWYLRRVITLSTGAFAVSMTAGGYVLSYLLNKFVKTTIYLASYDQENRLLRRLFDPTVWPALVRTMVGQSWYLAATSCGLVGVAVAYSVSRLRADGGRRTMADDPQRLGLLVLLAGSAMIIFTGGLQLLYGSRGDHLIYGRYVEMLVPALLVVACVAYEKSMHLARRMWLLTGLGVMGVAVVYVLVDWGDGVKGGYSRRDIVFPNIVGTDAARYIVQPGLLTFGAFFMIVTVVLWWISRKAGAWSIVLLVAALGIGSMYSGHRSVLTRTRDLEQVTQTVNFVRDSDAKMVGFDQGVRNDRSYYYLRFKLHPVNVVRFDLSSELASIPQSYSCVYAFPDRPPSDGAWEQVAVETVLERVLWKRTGLSGC